MTTHEVPSMDEKLNRFTLDEAPHVDLGRGVRGRYGLCPTGSILLNPANVRTHSKRQVGKIARSMEAAGPLAPAIIDERYVLLAGEARLAACKQRGEPTMPVVQVFGLSDAKKRAFLIADNRLAQDAGWDRQALFQQMPELTALLDEAAMTIEDTGFEVAELDELAADFGDGSDPQDDVAQALLNGPAVLRTGDLVTLGRHRLLVGDCREAASLDRLCAGEQAAAAFLDPPYNVSIRDVVGRGRTKHGEFSLASGEMSRAEFTTFLQATLGQAARVSRSGAVHYVCMDRKHVRDLMEVGEAVYGANLDLVVWNKTNAGQGGLYRQQHELIGVFRVGVERHRDNVQMGRFGRNRSNVWTYAGANTFRAGRMADLAAHPTVKPLRLVADALRDVTASGEAILDLFAGSGTTILAAEKVGRRALAMEIDPKYADVAVRRWQAMTRCDAMCEEGGVTYDELAAGRAIISP